MSEYTDNTNTSKPIFDCKNNDELIEELRKENERLKSLLKGWMERAEQLGYDPHYINELYFDTQKALKEKK